ncbi:NAC transcription factor 29 [Apostasia shenzhenica]|uniref:NAC transcription factor 29 n=1 Tax=Apostasia shenzhenica TaxID=1088818 RepID=A0A2I0AG57_9ASPA|nr:NAC transcription factor 29 [Apostasia shenzhenica]
MGEEGGSSSTLPPGFRFFPSDEELVRHFLRRKTAMLPGQPDVIIPTLDLCRFDPWDLHRKALQGGNYWYFFAHRTKNIIRSTPNGYWSNSGIADKAVTDVGTRSALAFFSGIAPKGRKTNWVMHEYRLAKRLVISSSSSASGRKPSSKKSHGRADAGKWVVCRVFEAGCGSQEGGHDEDAMELSTMDEMFLSFEDYEEVSLPVN